MGLVVAGVDHRGAGGDVSAKVGMRATLQAIGHSGHIDSASQDVMDGFVYDMDHDGCDGHCRIRNQFHEFSVRGERDRSAGCLVLQSFPHFGNSTAGSSRAEYLYSCPEHGFDDEHAETLDEFGGRIGGWHGFLLALTLLDSMKIVNGM